jgi:hypothetical protein
LKRGFLNRSSIKGRRDASHMKVGNCNVEDSARQSSSKFVHSATKESWNKDDSKKKVMVRKVEVLFISCHSMRLVS